MSERKLHIIISRTGGKTYFCGNRLIPKWSDDLVSLCGSYEIAKEIAEENDGQPVTFVEEPEKVVLTKKQAEIVENARDEEYPATYISDNSDVGASGEEELLMKAYVNGYTVEKEKKYYVKVPLVQAQGGLWFLHQQRRQARRQLPPRDCQEIHD